MDIDLTNILPKVDRDLVVTGLQALWRERVAAWNVATSVAELRNETAPDRSLFGIGEVVEMLRRFGAAV